jgi:hypothetical protein
VPLFGVARLVVRPRRGIPLDSVRSVGCRPWNSTDVRITDPGGHRLVLTAQRTVPDPELAARMREMLERGRR